MKGAIAVLIVAATAAVLSAHGEERSIPERTKGAQKVVVGKVSEVFSRFDVSPWGDQIIVSQATVEVEETLKGASEPHLTLLVEGGTIAGLTLTVSDLPSLKRGDRAVFFLEQGKPGEHVLHQRGAGVLKLDVNGRVEGTDLNLDAVGRMVRQSR